eukprot:1938438-Pyramimonas_sp.AAC.1
MLYVTLHWGVECTLAVIGTGGPSVFFGASLSDCLRFRATFGRLRATFGASERFSVRLGAIVGARLRVGAGVHIIGTCVSTSARPVERTRRRSSSRKSVCSMDSGKATMRGGRRFFSFLRESSCRWSGARPPAHNVNA